MAFLPDQGIKPAPLHPEVQTRKVGRNCRDSSAEQACSSSHTKPQTHVRPWGGARGSQRRRLGIFFPNEKKNLTISCESMECVYYNKKNNLTPQVSVYSCTLRKVSWDCWGTWGTCPPPPRAAPAPAPTAPDLKPHLLHGPLQLPSRSLTSGLDLFPPLYLSHH